MRTPDPEGYDDYWLGSSDEHAVPAWGSDPEETSWSDLGFDEGEAIEWQAAGFEARQAASWSDLGYSSRDATTWSQNYTLSKSAEIRTWMRWAEPHPVSEVKSAGLRLTKANVRRWYGLSAAGVLNAIDRGFPSAERYSGYAGSNIEFSVAELIEIEALETGATAPTDPGVLDVVGPLVSSGVPLVAATDWATAGLPASNFAAWSQLGLDPSETVAWARTGITPEAVKNWTAAGFVAPTSAAEWIEAGVKPSDAEVWAAHGFGARIALPWHKAGISPQHAARRAAAGVKPPTLKRTTSVVDV